MRKHILYKLYYGAYCVYLGRTEQPISNRLRGHFFSKPMHRKIHLPSISKIEIAECTSTADMYLYEVYYINQLKPTLNLDDKADDDLSVNLPELMFAEYKPKLQDKWLQQILDIEAKEEERHLKNKCREEERNLARKTLSGDEWDDWLEKHQIREWE